jgi:predicted acyl esterase
MRGSPQIAPALGWGSGWMEVRRGRVLTSPPYDNLGLPYHRSYTEDMQIVPEGKPVALTFSLLPTANFFEAGHRIRITITGADADSTALFPWPPASTVQIFRSAQYPSSVLLPVMQP